MSQIQVIFSVVGGLVTILGAVWGVSKLLYKKVKKPFAIIDGDLVRESYETMMNKPPWPSGTCLYRFHLKYQGEQNMEIEKVQLEWRGTKENKGWTESAGGYFKKADSFWHTPMEFSKGDVIPVVVPMPLPYPGASQQPADCKHFGVSFKTNKSNERTFIPLSKMAWDKFNCQEFRRLFKGA